MGTMISRSAFAVFVVRPGCERPWPLQRRGAGLPTFPGYAIFNTLAEAEAEADRLNASRRGASTYRASPFAWNEMRVTTDQIVLGRDLARDRSRDH